MSNELYHYVESGLDDVWLKNGYERHDSRRGQSMSIKDIDALHQAIGEHLSRNKRDLTGAEIRFLRQEMLMSQAILAGLLDVKELTVHRWETGKNSAPKTAEALIRFLYLEQIGSRAGKIKASLRRIADLEDRIDLQQALIFRFSDDDSHNWALAA
ncbi:MAG: hypothetical protein OXF74_07510 [Rhodobacteraceae bacterium]|nr:hypothetical protein [Paracoccaceae bacterium]